MLAVGVFFCLFRSLMEDGINRVVFVGRGWVSGLVDVYFMRGWRKYIKKMGLVDGSPRAKIIWVVGQEIWLKGKQ